MRYLARTFAIGLIAIIAGLVLTPHLEASQDRIIDKHGKEYRGKVVAEDREQVIMEINGVRTAFKRDDIRKQDVVPSVEDIYRERRDKIKDDDVNKRYELVRWLITEKEYKLAQIELEKLAKRFPEDGRIKRELVIINARQKVKERTQTPKSATQPSKTRQDADKPVARRPGDRRPRDPRRRDDKLPTKMLSKDQINLIKVYEIRIDDRPRVVISRSVIDAFLKKYADRAEMPKDSESLQELRTAPGYIQLAMMFDVRARDFYGKVQVRSDPQFITRFRKRIQPNYVLNYCATSACHGGPNAGKFFLFRPKGPTAMAATYTNFYLLSKYETKKGYMINRDRPERSYLLEYGLPRIVSNAVHPEAKGWRPRLDDREAPRYLEVLQWLEDLEAPAPNYQIDYEVPRITPTKEGPAKAKKGSQRPTPRQTGQ